MFRGFFAVVIVAAVFISSPASAIQCMSSKYLATALHNQGERVEWRGITSGNLAMLLINRTTRKWSVIVTNPSSIACIVVFGTDSEIISRATTIAPPRNDR